MNEAPSAFCWVGQRWFPPASKEPVGGLLPSLLYSFTPQLTDNKNNNRRTENRNASTTSSTCQHLQQHISQAQWSRRARHVSPCPGQLGLGELGRWRAALICFSLSPTRSAHTVRDHRAGVRGGGEAAAKAHLSPGTPPSQHPWGLRPQAGALGQGLVWAPRQPNSLPTT